MKRLWALAAALLAAAVCAQGERPDLPAPAGGGVEAPAVKPEAPALKPCKAPLATVMLTDDPYNTPVEAAEQWRGLRMTAWHTVAAELARQSGCFTLTDPDPLLLALPGAALPEAILRVRPLRLTLYQKSITDKINEGITGYIESYTAWLGAKVTEGPPLLSELGVTVSVLCPRERRIVREVSIDDREAPTALIDEKREHSGARQNAARARRAIGRALDDIARRIDRGERLCAAAAAVPAGLPQDAGGANRPPSTGPAAPPPAGGLAPAVR